MDKIEVVHTDRSWRQKFGAFLDGAARIGEGLSRMSLIPEPVRVASDQEEFGHDSARVLGDIGIHGTDQSMNSEVERKGE